jgi:hypothetical protein
MDDIGAAFGFAETDNKMFTKVEAKMLKWLVQPDVAADTHA